MSKPEFSKKFSLQDAKAGAPFSQADGDGVEMLKWDMSGKFPLVGVAKNTTAADRIEHWSATGAPRDMGHIRASLVMLPLGMIDGKPVFVGDEVQGPYVKFTVAPSHHGGNWERCKWPAPARVYPKTQMQDAELFSAVDIPAQSVHDRARSVADMALRHAVDNGYLVTLEEAKAEYKKGYIAGEGRAEKARAARDMAVAVEVRKACRQAADHEGRRARIESVGAVDLVRIIASVTP